MKIWNTSIGNATEIAASMPHWYARTTVIDLKRATLEDGSLDFSKASTQFVEGDKVMFIPCNDFDNVLVDNKGLVFTVATVSPSMHYTFEEGSVGKEGLFFVVKFMYNKHLTPGSEVAMVPVTLEMVDNDRKTTKVLRSVGLKQPGWYRWRSVDRKERDPMITCELLVSVKNFHSPDGTSGDAGESFQPGQGLDPSDGQLIFDPVDGSITLG